MTRRKLAPTFPTEAALCADFIAKVKKQPWGKDVGTWVCYAETAGWDILMVRKEDGCQIGIEAKLDLNLAVVNQALNGSGAVYREEGPDFRAVLVPAERINQDYVPLCNAIGITVMWIPYDPERYYHFHPHPPTIKGTYNWGNEWHPMLPMKRHVLPEYIPDVIAGASAPVQLSPWKIAALKLCVLLEDGPVNRADLKALNLSPTRWTDRHFGWLQPTAQGYLKSQRCPDFPGQHPEVYAQIRADKSKWAFERTIAAAQRSLGLENE